MDIFRSVLVAAGVLCLASCATTRVDEWVGNLNPFRSRPASDASAQYAAAADIALPIKRTLTIYMAPRDLARRTRIPETDAHSEYWLDEGKFVQGAAMKAFARLFERVSPGREQGNAYPVATVRGSSGFNPMLGRYSATVVVTFSSERNVPIAELEAKSSADGYDPADFAKALDAAFQDIQAQFLNSKALVAAFERADAEAAIAAQPPAGTESVGAAPAKPSAEKPAVTQPSPPQEVAAQNPERQMQVRPAGPTHAVETQEAARAAVKPQPSQPATAAAPTRLPIGGELGIYRAPEMLDKQTFVNTGYSSYWFNEGRMIQESATQSFGRLFERVSPLEDDDVRYPMVSVDGTSSYNPTMRTYAVKVVVEFFPRSGDPVASLTAHSTAQGEGETGFEKAYRAAFADIEKQFVDDRELVATLADSAIRAKSSTSSPGRADASAAATPRITIPSSGILILYIAPEELKKQTVIAGGYGYASYWVDEGKAIQRAAIKTFGTIFRQVSSGSRNEDADPVLTVHGTGSFNPIMEAYSTQVVATFSAKGARLGRYEAKATVGEHGQGEIGFEKAYSAAFQAIVDQLVKAGRL
jgi:hypothetical protein